MTQKPIKLKTFLVLIVICFIGGHYISSQSFKSDECLEKYIARKASFTQKTRPITILAKAEKNGLLAVMYSDGTKREKLISFTKDSLFKNRFRYSFESSHSALIGTSTMTDPLCGAFFIVYGVNKNLKANWYKFTYGENEVTKQNLGEFVLDIYSTEGKNQFLSYDLASYTKDNEQILRAQ